MKEKSIEDAIKAIAESPKNSTVYIGADSTRFRNKKEEWFARYSTIIVLHIGSKHGCKLFHTCVVQRDYGNLKQRLLTEVQYAIDAATKLIDALGDRKLEIHLDLNSDPKHKSNIAVKEALGWVKGMTGLEAKIKPESFAASHAADHVLRM